MVKRCARFIIFLLALGLLTPAALAQTTRAASVPGRVRLVLPQMVYAAPGIESNLYLDNIILVLNPANYSFEVRCAKGRHYEERWALTPVPEDAGDYPLEIIVRDEANAEVARGQTIVRVAPLDAGSREKTTTALLVGDSLTQAAIYPRHVHELAEKDPNLQLKLIGCRGPQNAPATGPVRFEGYNGWTAAAYVSSRGPLSRTGEYKRPETGSPFVYDDTPQGPHLDFTRYCKQFNDGQGPDFITILLGSNDLARATDETIDQDVDRMLGNVDQLIAAFHHTRADTAIGIVLTIPPSRSQDGFYNRMGERHLTRTQFRRNLHRGVERMAQRYGSRDAEHIYLVPAYANLDTRRGYASTTQPANARTTHTLSRLRDGVHPADEGYLQVGDSIYCWMKCVIARGDR